MATNQTDYQTSTGSTLAHVTAVLQQVEEALDAVGLTKLVSDYTQIYDAAGSTTNVTNMTRSRRVLEYKFNDGIGDDIYISIAAFYNASAWYSGLVYFTGNGSSYTQSVRHNAYLLADTYSSTTWVEACFKDSSLAVRINMNNTASLEAFDFHLVERAGAAVGSPTGDSWVCAWITRDNYGGQGLSVVIPNISKTDTSIVYPYHAKAQDGVIPLVPLTWASNGTQATSVGMVLALDSMVGAGKEVAVNDGTTERTYRSPVYDTGSVTWMLRWE